MCNKYATSKITISYLSHIYVECPQGKYGRDCAEDCICRSVIECNHIDGSCSCQPGYTGDDCTQGEIIRHIRILTNF